MGGNVEEAFYARHEKQAEIDRADRLAEAYGSASLPADTVLLLSVRDKPRQRSELVIANRKRVLLHVYSPGHQRDYVDLLKALGHKVRTIDVTDA